jgi:hemoglobin
MNDINDEKDISVWLHQFYEKLLKDPITAPKFGHLDLPEHMDKIVQFWAFVLLDKDGYKTNVFERHIHLNLEKIHFDLWIKYFFQTTNELFKGPKAETAKSRALILATTFMHKIHGEYYDFTPNLEA